MSTVAQTHQTVALIGGTINIICRTQEALLDALGLPVAYFVLTCVITLLNICLLRKIKVLINENKYY